MHKNKENIYTLWHRAYAPFFTRLFQILVKKGHQVKKWRKKGYIGPMS